MSPRTPAGGGSGITQGMWGWDVKELHRRRFTGGGAEVERLLRLFGALSGFTVRHCLVETREHG